MAETNKPQSVHERAKRSRKGPQAVASRLDYGPTSLKPPLQDQSKPDDLLEIGGQFLDNNKSSDRHSENVLTKGTSVDFTAYHKDSKCWGYPPSPHVSHMTDPFVWSPTLSTPPVASETLYGSSQFGDRETANSFFDSGYGSTFAEPYTDITLPHHNAAQTSMSGTTSKKRRKFSDEEKLQISAVRKVGACSSCKKRKVKCTHVTINTLALRPSNGGFENDQWRELKGLQEQETSESDLSNLEDRIDAISTQGRSRDVFIDQSMEQAVRNSIADAKHQALTFLMKHVYAKLNFRYSSNIKTCPGGETQDSSESPEKSSSGQKQRGADPQNGKRARSDDGSLSDEHNGKKGRPNKIVLKEPNSRKRFACPLFKNDPRKFSCNDETGNLYRTCSTTRFRDIGEVKQHCERIHRNVAQCPRCWTVMKNQKALQRHRHQPCELSPEQPEGITDPKWALIKNKKERITWTEIYGILFPGDIVPSCWFEQSDMDRKPSAPRSRAETVRRETLRLVEESLYRVLDSELGPIVERILASLDDDITSCQQVAETKNALKDSGPSERREMGLNSNIVGAKGADSHNLISQVPSRSNQTDTLEAMVTNDLGFNGDVRPVSLDSNPAINVDSGYQSGHGACPCSCHVLANSQLSYLCPNIHCRDSTCSWSSSVTTDTGDSHGVRNLRPDAFGSEAVDNNNGNINPDCLEIRAFETTRSTSNGNAHNDLNPNDFGPIGFDYSGFDLDSVDPVSFEFNEEFDLNCS